MQYFVVLNNAAASMSTIRQCGVFILKLLYQGIHAGRTGLLPLDRQMVKRISCFAVVQMIGPASWRNRAASAGSHSATRQVDMWHYRRGKTRSSSVWYQVPEKLPGIPWKTRHWKVWWEHRSSATVSCNNEPWFRVGGLSSFFHRKLSQFEINWNNLRLIYHLIIN